VTRKGGVKAFDSNSEKKNNDNGGNRGEEKGRSQEEGRRNT
jgi:hypothetical protein